MEEERKSLRDEVLEMKEMIENPRGKKPKPFRLPFKARLNKGNLRKGYITVIHYNENKGMDFTKEPIVDGTIKLNDTFHAIKEKDIFNYKGKPCVSMAKNKINPFNPIDGEHETYGQKYIIARMEGDKITGKKKIGLGLSLGVVIIVAIIGYALFTGGS